MPGAMRMGRAGGLLVDSLAFTRYCFTLRPFVHESIIIVLPTPTCIAHTVAILLLYHCAIFEPPPTPHVYAIHHTILCIAIACKS